MAESLSSTPLPILQARLASIATALQSLAAERKKLVAEEDAIRIEISSRAAGVQAPRVSDHAVLRYLERSLEIPVDKVREKLLSLTRSAIEAGAASVKVDGLRFVIQDKTVVTVIDQ